MDIQLARTFLEIIAAGSFIHAADRLHVTQSAVSLRVKKLEGELGRDVFVRAKSGIVLTPAGLQFERYARSLMKVWEEAKYHVAVPDGYDDVLDFGVQYSLWPKLGGRWLRKLEIELPDIALHAEIGMPDRLMRLMIQGTIDIGIMYTPQLRPGLNVTELVEETLILVSADPDYGPDLDENYVLMDWGPEFAIAHSFHFPDFQMARTTLSIGPLAINFIIELNRAAYFPTRVVKPFIDSGHLHVVSGAPVFPYPAYVVWNEEKSPELIDKALGLLRLCAEEVDQEQDAIMKDADINLDEQLAGYS